MASHASRALLEVRPWLLQNGLGEYADKFEEEGFSDIDTVVFALADERTVDKCLDTLMVNKEGHRQKLKLLAKQMIEKDKHRYGAIPGSSSG
jgi:hypothetical protein